MLVQGQILSPGIAIGKVFLLEDDHSNPVEVTVLPNRVQAEIEKFKKAVQDTILDLQLLIDQIGEKVSAHKREIFDAHLMILDDSNIIEQTITKIHNEHVTAEYAYSTVMSSYQRTIADSQDTYLQERATDIRDIKRRVIRKITGGHLKQFTDLTGTIIFAKDVNIFDVTALEQQNAAGFVLENVGRTTHTAIIIRALEIPCIIGISKLLIKLRQNDICIVDGITGEIILRPSQLTIKKYQEKLKNYKKYQLQYRRIGHLPNTSYDGKSFIVNANIELPDEADIVKQSGDFGIGLFRTEYLFMAANRLPTEEEQYEKYTEVVKRINPYPVTIRTLDVGGDKTVPFLESEKERNPSLGWRGIRICLDMPDLFKKQLRAILRASVWGNIKIMFPLISSPHEILHAKNLLENAQTELQYQNIDFDSNIPVGIMIEVPSSVILADKLAQNVDFFSIGTNDLIQYTLAVDRSNTKVSNLYNAFHPAVLRMIKHTVQIARKYNIPVGLCGEMAGDPLAALLLFGLGIAEFSVSPIMLLRIKQILRSIEFLEAQKISNRCLRLSSSEEIEDYLHHTMHILFPGMDEDNYFYIK